MESWTEPKKSFMLANGHFLSVWQLDQTRQPYLLANDKEDNVVNPGIVHRSPEIYFGAKLSPERP